MSLYANFFCQFNTTGVGRHCENAFFSMSRLRPEGMAVEYCNYAREDSVRRVLSRAQPGTDVTLFFWRFPPPFVEQFRGRRILWWFFESDRLPQKWLDELRPHDELWAPSGWARDILLAHHIAPGRIRVMESGVNARVFKPQPVAHEGFVFLCVGKYEKRKSVDETIAAFEAEFPAARYPAVELWLKADFPLFPERAGQLAERVAHDARVRVISGTFTDEQMAALYNRADAFVFPSKAEGFGLPCLEALACGLPAVTTAVSAQTAFLDRIPGLYMPVQYTMAPIDDPDYRHFYGRDYAGETFGNWALPSVESIRSGMRAVFDDHAAWRARGAQAAEVVRQAFSWDAIARKAIAGLLEASAGGPS